MANVDTLLDEFDNDLLEEEWNRVSVEYPVIADRIQRLVFAGVTPKDISRQVVRRIGNTRTGMARHLENAAQFWYNQRLTSSKTSGVSVAGGR